MASMLKKLAVGKSTNKFAYLAAFVSSVFPTARTVKYAIRSDNESSPAIAQINKILRLFAHARREAGEF